MTSLAAIPGAREREAGISRNDLWIFGFTRGARVLRNDDASHRNLFSNAISVSRSLGSSGASVSRVTASAWGATFSASC